MKPDQIENSWIGRGEKFFGPGEVDFQMTVDTKELEEFTTESMEANPDDRSKWVFIGYYRSFRLIMRLGNLRRAYITTGISKEDLASLLAQALRDLSIQLERPYVPLEEKLVPPYPNKWEEILDSQREIK